MNTTEQTKDVDLLRADHTLMSQFDRDGFAVIPDVIAPSNAAVMREELADAIIEQNNKWGHSPYYIDHNMVHNLMFYSDSFLHILSNPVMHRYLAAALDEYCILYAYTSSTIPPSGQNYSSRVHVDSPRLIPGYPTNIGFIIALDDFTDDNGATWFLPGSHLSATTPSEDEFFAGAKRVYPKAGSGVLFNARTFHYGGLNNTKRARHAVTMNICRSFMRQRFDYPRLMPPKMIDKLDDVGRRFIGWNVRVPTSLEEYYVPPEERLYKGNQG